MHIQLVTYLLLGLIVSMVLTPIVIWIMQQHHLYQPRRIDGPKTHFIKGKVPPAGGIVFWLGLAILLLIIVIEPTLVRDFITDKPDIRLMMICILAGTLILGLVGFLDDLSKITSQKTKGIPARYKIIIQFFVPSVALFIVTHFTAEVKPHQLIVPSGHIVLPDWLLYTFSIFCFMGIINGMNFLDGLDGLAGGSSIITFIALGLVNRLDASIAGLTAGLVSGFLVYNIRPARIYMGDTGSYTLGALLGLICILEGLHLFLAIGCLLYAIEVLSVVVQVIVFRLTGKRILKMSPLHHHFELSGWSEWKIVITFWLANTAFAALALIMLMPK